MSGFSSPPYKLSHVVGQPVDYRYYDGAESQRNALSTVLQHFLRGGVRASDIVVLSRLKLERSGVLGCGGSDFRLSDAEELPYANGVPTIRFSTIQAFKGLESPVVVLCDVDPLSASETQNLLYVAMSRARCELVVLMDERTRPYVLERLRSKLSMEIAK
jgi:superfamily I DNA/RNA helicase